MEIASQNMYIFRGIFLTRSNGVWWLMDANIFKNKFWSFLSTFCGTKTFLNPAKPLCSIKKEKTPKKITPCRCFLLLKNSIAISSYNLYSLKCTYFKFKTIRPNDRVENFSKIDRVKIIHLYLLFQSLCSSRILVLNFH